MGSACLIRVVGDCARRGGGDSFSKFGEEIDRGDKAPFTLPKLREGTDQVGVKSLFRVDRRHAEKQNPYLLSKVRDSGTCC